ncbi:DNA polymerase III subunit delta [Caminicella sporogenes]|uniref:DNA polymerase III subunit delta n=1 Tax=Caminicella sporogenes TaxID=166485 RepID=UPI0025413ACB|nr:DNA polymerase III subunit delta [Caminicella sporogenes]WIF94822.1 DNA polymerase III subunit delta [Caminicella sporogenes]
MDYKVFLNDIQNKKLARLYLLYGNEKYLLDKALHNLKKTYINSVNENFNYVYYEEFKDGIDELIDSCETLPFMGEKRIIIVNNEDFFSSKKNVLGGEEEKLIRYFNNMPETTCLIFISGSNVDKRKKLFKEVKKVGKILEFARLKRQDLAKWISRYIKENKKSIEINDLQVLIDLLGYLDSNSNKTLYDVENELKKLCNFTVEKTKIEIDDIEKIISRPVENNIFELVDAVGEKNGSRALKIFNNMLVAGEPEGRILYMIIRQFKILNLVKLMVDKGYTTIAIAPRLSLPQYIVKKYLRQANSFSQRDLINILNNGLKADKDIKNGKMPPKLAIEILIAESCKI